MKHKIYFIIQVYWDHIYAWVEIFDALKLLSKQHAPQGKPTKNLTIDIISESLYVDIMSLFSLHIIVIYFFIHQL